MERMPTREYVELPFEHGNEAQVTHLTGADGDVLVPLTSLFSSEALGVLRVVLNLSSEALDLALVIFETLAEMLLHLFYLGFPREQIEEILYFQDASRFIPDGF
jgi:hypothetical protein